MIGATPRPQVSFIGKCARSVIVEMAYAYGWQGDKVNADV